MDIKEDPFTPIVDIDRNLPTDPTKQFSVSLHCTHSIGITAALSALTTIIVICA